MIRLLALWLGQSNEFIRRFSWGNSSDAFHCAWEVFFPSLSSLLAWDSSSAHCAQSSVAQQQHRKGKENSTFLWRSRITKGLHVRRTSRRDSWNERQKYNDSGSCNLKPELSVLILSEQQQALKTSENKGKLTIKDFLLLKICSISKTQSSKIKIKSKCGRLTAHYCLTVHLTHVHTFVELTQYMTASGKVGPGWLMCSLPGSRTIRADKRTSGVICDSFTVSHPKLLSEVSLRTQRKWSSEQQLQLKKKNSVNKIK